MVESREICAASEMKFAESECLPATGNRRICRYGHGGQVSLFPKRARGILDQSRPSGMYCPLHTTLLWLAEGEPGGRVVEHAAEADPDGLGASGEFFRSIVVASQLGEQLHEFVESGR